MLVRRSLILGQNQSRTHLQSICSVRYLVNAASTKSSENISSVKHSVEWENARPFEEIPGPTIMQLITRNLPGGRYFKKKLFEMHTLVKEEYGVLTKFPGMFGRKPILITFDQNDIEKVFRTEGIQPVRNGLDTLVYYRKEYRKEQFGGNSGLITEQGDIWADQRSKVNPIMLMPKTVKKYIPGVEDVALDFIERMRAYRGENNEMPAHYGQELNKWALESIGTIALDTRLGCLKAQSNPEVERFINYVRRFFELAYELDVQPSIWKIYKTKMFYEMMNVFDGINEYVSHYIDKSVKELSNKQEEVFDHEQSVLQKLLKIDRQTAIIMASDMLLAGVDTTSSYLISCLYQLASNPDKQEKLREEVNQILPTVNSRLTEDSLQNIPYLRACLKESLRLNPVTAGNLRALGQDLVLSGYRVPKGSDVAMGNVLLGWDDKNFDKWDEFIPERWLKNANESECPVKSTKNLHPFVFLPFGHGPRTCIGRRFAELEVEVMLLRLLREFKIEWKYGPLDYRNSIVNFPTNDLKFAFIDLK